MQRVSLLVSSPSYEVGELQIWSVFQSRPGLASDRLSDEFGTTGPGFELAQIPESGCFGRTSTGHLGRGAEARASENSGLGATRHPSCGGTPASRTFGTPKFGPGFPLGPLPPQGRLRLWRHCGGVAEDHDWLYEYQTWATTIQTNNQTRSYWQCNLHGIEERPQQKAEKQPVDSIPSI